MHILSDQAIQGVSGGWGSPTEAAVVAYVELVGSVFTSSITAALAVICIAPPLGGQARPVYASALGTLAAGALSILLFVNGAGHLYDATYGAESKNV